jgi:hypothetical protein
MNGWMGETICCLGDLMQTILLIDIVDGSNPCWVSWDGFDTICTGLAHILYVL